MVRCAFSGGIWPYPWILLLTSVWCRNIGKTIYEIFPKDRCFYACRFLPFSVFWTCLGQNESFSKNFFINILRIKSSTSPEIFIKIGHHFGMSGWVHVEWPIKKIIFVEVVQRFLQTPVLCPFSVLLSFRKALVDQMKKSSMNMNEYDLTVKY